MTAPGDIRGNYSQGMDDAHFCLLQSRDEIGFTIIVRKKSHSPPIHSVDGNPFIEMAMQRLKHKPVTPEGDNYIRLLRRYSAVALLQAIASSASLVALGGDKGNAFKPSSSCRYPS